MADYTKRDITTVERRYELPSPTNWVEVGKVLNAIQQDFEGQRTYDDTVKVEAYDDEIHFTYRISQEESTPALPAGDSTPTEGAT
jgi:hypothetical protein